MLILYKYSGGISLRSVMAETNRHIQKPRTIITVKVKALLAGTKVHAGSGGLNFWALGLSMYPMPFVKKPTFKTWKG